MPGNRPIFDRAIEGYRHAAQLEDWPQAFRDAVRAVQEFPSDVEARSYLAISLYHTGRYPQAAQLLEELRQRRGDDPLTLAYLARAYEGNQQFERAGAVLLAIAEQALEQRRLPDAVEAFEEVIRIEPAREDVRIRLAEVLVEMGDQRAAAEQCIAIAQGRMARGDYAGAGEALEEATGLDGANQAAHLVRSQLAELTAAATPAVTEALPPPLQSAKPRGTTGSLRRGTGRLRGTSGLRRGTGVLQAPVSMIDQLVAAAVQLQATGEFAAARSAYEQLLAQGAERNDVLYNLGVVYAELGEHERAVELLRRVHAADEYALSAAFALGQSLRASGATRAAAEQFEVTIRLVDLETISRTEADDLVSMYEAAAECYSELGEMSRAASLYGMLASFLLSKRWGKELGDQFKQRAKELTERSMFAKLRSIGTGALPGERGPNPPPLPTGANITPAAEVWGALPSLSDFLKGDVATVPVRTTEQMTAPFTLSEVPAADHPSYLPVTPIMTDGCSDMLVGLVAASSHFVEQGLIYAALDACHEVIRLEPEFLPIHLRLGEIYERDGRPDDAVIKYRTLVDAYAARGKQSDAISVYYRLIDLSSDTVPTRVALIELLRQAGRLEEAVSQTLLLANTYFKIGQTNRALEEFRQLQQWAPRSSSIHKEYGQALFKLERWEAALTEFRRAAQFDPADPVALAELNMTLAVLGQHERALWDSFAALLEKLRAAPHQLPDVQSTYRASLLIVDAPLLHYLLGLIQQFADQHASATLSFEQALELLVMEEQPPIPALLVHQALAESYSAQGQAQAAIDQLHTAQRLFTNQPVVATMPYLFARPLTPAEVERRLASALATVGDWQAAINALDHCLKLDPTDFAAYTQLADIYFRQGKLPQALAQYEKLASVYEEHQQLDPAIATLQDAVKLAPSALEIRSRLAQLLIRRGTLDRGLKELLEVALLQKQAGQIKDAVLSLQQAAEVYWMLGQHDHAFHIYRQILMLAPHDLDARQRLVNLHIPAGQREAAIAQQRHIAEMYQEQQQYSEAIAALHQIIALDPTDAAAYEHLGDLLLRVKEYDQAVRLFRRLARLRPDDAHIQALQSTAERMVTMQREQAA
ncbi:MAG: tetratricopeptide repeat protein [Herpetosiphonaceae bacterium]|nr:tetratricopeptide repeat protein [Herpetosiphonaceae bacterium]